MKIDYSAVTELPGVPSSAEQVARVFTRYHWARQYCEGREVLEIACGAGQGLGHLSRACNRLTAGDYSLNILRIARSHYGDRVPLLNLDAMKLPFRDASFDVALIFEAIYYLPDVPSFLLDCKRVLRRGGRLLIATANKDLPGFNPSPYSKKFYGIIELGDLLRSIGFSPEFFGDTPIDTVSFRQKALIPIKKIAVHFGLIPKTMIGKSFLKRIVFGRLMDMPAEIDEGGQQYQPPSPLDPHVADRRHKVIYSAASL
jgi:SAM-dependent methyltransferase